MSSCTESYNTLKAARFAARSFCANNSGASLVVYMCEDCGAWHKTESGRSSDGLNAKDDRFYSRFAGQRRGMR